ncbi:MAG: IS21 family transposase [Deltaproteobacteria bacterium]|nr:IS21 family transposase [Deltaproteobacteria bacterium]
MLVEGLSARQVAREMGLSRNTVRRYVAGAEPGVRKEPGRARPVFERVAKRIDAILEEAPRWTGGKQRLTAARLHQMLRVEGHQVGYTLVKQLVREWKRKRLEVFVPLVYAPGDLAEVDFFEVLVDISDERTKAFMFVMRLMHSGRDFAWLYERQDQVSFLDGHVRAFAHVGAVPQRIAYDNLKPAVKRILVGSERELTARFFALVNHALFEPCFARPRTGHDKGGVEARGRSIRWDHLVPIPTGADLDEVSQKLLAQLDADMAHTCNAEGKSVAERFAEEKGRMLPEPHRPFRAAAVVFPRASRRALVKIEAAYYSVWSDWKRLELTAYIGPRHIEIVGPDLPAVVHPRRRVGRSIDYRHYISELARKPQALRQVASELIPQLGPPYDKTWRLLVDAHGPKQAARVFAQVLSALQTRGEADVRARLEHALQNDEPLALALHVAEPEPPQLADELLPGDLRHIEVVAASAAEFDALLGGAQ